MSDFTRRWQRPEVIEAIFDQISDGIFVYDKNLHLVGVNRSGERLLGLSAGQMLGKPCWNLFRIAASEARLDALPGSRQSESTPSGTVTLLLDNGQQRRVTIQTIELRDESGSMEGVVATATEIGEPLALSLLPASQEPLPLSELAAGPAPREPAPKSILLRLPKRTASLAGALLLIFVSVLIGIKFLAPGGKRLTAQEQQRAAAEQSKREALAKFNAMTPAEHIERAKLALKGSTPDAFDEGLRHLKAIPASAPEFSRATALERDLSKAKDLAAAQSLIDSSATAQLRDGVQQLERASAIAQAIAQQYPNDPDAAKLAHGTQAAAEELVLRFPEDFAAEEIKLVEYNWERGGFGTVMIGHFTIRNDGPADVADVKIHCEHHTGDGVLVDENDGTAYGIVKAHSTTRIPNVNMGFLSSQPSRPQALKTNCAILSIKPASQSVTIRSMR